MSTYALHWIIQGEIYDPTKAVAVNHPDSHYAAACYRYIREYAIMLRDVCAFISLDDKHKIKVGSPTPQ